MNKIIYLDNNGTTYMHKKAKDIFKLDIDGNMSSLGQLGKQSKEIFNSCIDEIKDYFNITDNYNIIFTSGASESNCSLILSSVLEFIGEFKSIPTIIISEYEHKTTLKCCNYLENKGLCKLYKLSPNKMGIIEPYKLEELLNTLEDVVLVSIMHVNNEIGSKNDIYKLGSICRKFNITFHTDATQSIKFIDKFNLEYIDALSLSFHKFGGPKGCGLLVVNKNVKYMPIIAGSQQNGLRGGTENLHLIYSSTCALNETRRYRSIKNNIIGIMKNKMLAILKSYYNCYYFYELGKDFEKDLSDIKIIIFGPKDETLCVPNTMYFSIISNPTIDNNILVDSLNNKNIIVSKGSTCNSGLSEFSTSLLSLSENTCLIDCVIRISLGDINIHNMMKTVNSMCVICKEIKTVYLSINKKNQTAGKCLCKTN